MSNEEQNQPLQQAHVSRSFSAEDLQGIWQFANAQFSMIRNKQEESSNPTERMCLAFTANCIVDIMDEIAELLEPSENCG